MSKLIVNQVTQTTTQVKQTVNRIVMVDVSGSMYSELAKLRQHLKNKLPTMVTPGDTLTLGYFSGRGHFGTIVEDYSIDTAADLTNVNSMIDRFLVASGLTGFLEPLQDIKRLVKASTRDQFALSFMTDGYDNQWSKKEIMDACIELTDYLSAATFIEYGYYADHDMLVKMAEAVGGRVVLAKDFKQYQEELDVDFGPIGGGKRIVIDNIPSDVDFVMGLTGNSMILSAVKNGSVSLPPAVVKYGYITGDKPAIEVAPSDRVFAAAFVGALIQQGNSDKALTLAAAIGDVGLYKKVENSFSKQDYARTVDVATAIGLGKQPIGKFTKVNTNPNAYNVLQMLFDLSSVEGNSIVLSHPDFVYNRIGGKRSEPVDLPFVPVFTDKPGQQVLAPITTLKFDSDRPNVSILTRREGTVSLPDNNFGFGNSIDSFIWRNYTIIRDGIVNVDNLPVVLTKKTFDKLKSEGVLTGDYKVNQTYVIDLTSLPVINRSIAQKIDSTTIFKHEYEIYKLQCAQRYLKTLIDKPEVSQEYANKYGEEAALFLKNLGIGPNGFSAPSGKTIPGDSYTAKVLEIKLSGLSGVAKPSDVLDAIKSGKKLTPSQQTMANVIQSLQGTDPETELQNVKEQLIVARNQMVAYKFGIILGKTWFTDMANYEDNTREIDLGLGKLIKAQVILTDKEV